ncbi:hypothetical protein G4177_10755 [Corallococcus sp. ZKHCc1 1396]|uniref:Uncharacterized protein n=1 Tax=Corallococcus soli TaxID=2710757 RepID=A0ABR9PL59_9BACT|nr:hypothetical protein [Corallococcus soli]MBE4748642.1 hypothetical protein [Corallococcus soli]
MRSLLTQSGGAHGRKRLPGQRKPSRGVVGVQEMLRMLARATMRARSTRPDGGAWVGPLAS